MPQHGPVGTFPIKNKIVAITGGGSGIGFAFAQQCHQLGAKVIIGDLKLIPEAQAYLSSSPSAEITFKHCDVTHWKDLHDLISASVTHFGDVPDIYCPSAGIFEPSWSNFWDDNEGRDHEEEDPKLDGYATLRINVDHPLKFTRLALRALLGANKKGVVCLVASTAGIRANYLAALYCASKHAIVGFAKSMGQADIDEGVKVVCMLPGPVTTALWTQRQDQMFEWSKYAERDPCLPEEIAETMVRMVVDEKGEFEGGSCVLRTKAEERVVEKGHRALLEELKRYDPSPRPEYDLSRVRKAVDGERGKKWV